METVTGIGFKKKDRWRRVASSIALVVQLTAMLEAWRVAFRGSNQPRVFRTDLLDAFFFFFFSVCLFFNCNNRKMREKLENRPLEVSPLILRNFFN